MLDKKIYSEKQERGLGKKRIKTENKGVGQFLFVLFAFIIYYNIG